MSNFFTVWRPTSRDAIRLMMAGKATGKGLNVKGKSAKRGKLSGFVPFLQISEAAHKRLVPLSPAAARIRVYFANKPVSGACMPARLLVVHARVAAVAAHAGASSSPTTSVPLPRHPPKSQPDQFETNSNLIQT